MSTIQCIIMLVLCVAVGISLGVILLVFLKYLTRLEEKRWGKVARAKEWSSGLSKWLYKLAGGRREM